MVRPQSIDLIDTVHHHNINPQTREIFITPGKDSDEIDHIVANQFVKNLQLLNTTNHKCILIHMGTCGGDWNYGMMIYDAIVANPSYVVIVAYGHARSMSSIILQAADLRILTPNCDFMIHEGSMEYEGTTRGAKHNIAWNNHLTNIMYDIYAKKCQQGEFFKDWTLKRIKSYLQNEISKKEDWFIAPKQTVEYGFADHVIDSSTLGYIENLCDDK